MKYWVLIDNIYIQCGNVVFRQVKGIPMGTICAPFLANLFLFWYEFNWMKDMMRKDMKIAKKMSNTFRYLNDLVSINSDKLLNKYHSKIYPPELPQKIILMLIISMLKLKYSEILVLT